MNERGSTTIKLGGKGSLGANTTALDRQRNSWKTTTVALMAALASGAMLCSDDGEGFDAA